MSLDVTLYSPTKEKKTCPYCDSEHEEAEMLYDANITHNLNTMAGEAGIYKHLWRPEEIGATTAKDIIEGLSLGLTDLKNRPEHFKKFNSSNGWGMYKHFVPFVEKYLDACKENPEAVISISR